MYNILNPQDLDNLKTKEPKRFQYLAEGGLYLDLRKLDLNPIEGIDVDKIGSLSRIVRGLIFAAINGIKSGHPGGSSSKVEQVLALLTTGVLAFNTLDPKNTTRDRVIWSAGHCTPLFFAVLALIYESLRCEGHQIDKENLGAVLPECLANFRHCGGPAGHVESHYALADMSTGSSGHGFSASLIRLWSSE